MTIKELKRLVDQIADARAQLSTAQAMSQSSFEIVRLKKAHAQLMERLRNA